MPVYSFKKIVSESYRVLLAAVAIGLMGGFLLDTYSERMAAFALAMVPPINGIGGNIGSVLGARLSSELHLGTVTPKLRGQDALNKNLSAAGILALVLYGSVGGLFFVSSLAFGKSSVEALRISTVFFGSGMLLTAIIAFTSVTSAFVSYTRGIDPDNVVIPVVTTVVDVAGVISLLIMLNIMGM